MATPGRQTWFSRNWKWFVPAGCLSALLLFGGFIALILSIAMGSVKSSDAYRLAMDRAKASPSVREALGSPISEGLFVSGSMSVNGPRGTASLSIPVSGPRERGRSTPRRRRRSASGRFRTYVFEAAATKERVDLLEETK